MNKAELSKQATKAIAIMKKNGQKGWKSFFKKSNLTTKKGKKPAEYYGGIYKGNFTIYINKGRNEKVPSYYYSIYVSKEQKGIIADELSLAHNPTANPYQLFVDQCLQIKKQMTVLKNYLISVK